MASSAAAPAFGTLRPHRPHSQRGGFFAVFDDPFLGGEVLEYLTLKEALPLRASCIAGCDAVSAHEWRGPSHRLSLWKPSPTKLRGNSACFPHPTSLHIRDYHADTVALDLRPFGGTRDVLFDGLDFLKARALAPFDSAQDVTIRYCPRMDGSVLMHLKSARSLSLANFALNDFDLSMVSSTVTRLKIYDASPHSAITERGLAALVNVRELRIDYAWLSTGAVFAQLPRLQILALTSHPPLRPSQAHSARLRALAAAPSLAELILDCDAFNYGTGAFGPDPRPQDEPAFFCRRRRHCDAASHYAASLQLLRLYGRKLCIHESLDGTQLLRLRLLHGRCASALQRHRGARRRGVLTS